MSLNDEVLKLFMERRLMRIVLGWLCVFFEFTPPRAALRGGDVFQGIDPARVPSHGEPPPQPCRLRLQPWPSGSRMTCWIDCPRASLPANCLTGWHICAWTGWWRNRETSGRRWRQRLPDWHKVAPGSGWKERPEVGSAIVS